MFGVEIDMVVKDSLEALELYESVFEVERVETGDFVKGTNEVVLNIYGTRFHLLDENDQCGLVAPKEGVRLPIWFNIVVLDIKSIFTKAETQGFTVIIPISENQEMGMSNTILKDPFGYVWMLHQIDKEVSYEERCKIFEAQGFERRK